MKVYVLVDEWARDEAGEVNVIGIFKDKKKAQQEMFKYAEENFTTKMETKISDDDSICQFETGCYQTMHDNVFIQEKEIID